MYGPETYVEVGVQHAYTFNQVSPLVQRAIAVDIADMPKVTKLPNVEIFKMNSSQFSTLWGVKKNPSIDLLFIDGDHNYKSVLKDFYLLKDYVTLGTGIVLLHDTYPSAEFMLQEGYSYNAWKAARSIFLDSSFWEIFTFPGPYAGLSILRNAENHLHWYDEVFTELT